jgi:hypothetical protein
MKFKAIFILLIFKFQFIFSQDPKINFGKIYIGMSSDSINELVYKKIVKNKKEYFKVPEFKVIEFYLDTTEAIPFHPQLSLDKRENVFFLPILKLSENISVAEVYLKFFEDKLYSFECNSNPDLIEALDLKFGKRTIVVKEEEQTYTFKYGGNKITKVDKLFTSTWPIESANISCIGIFKVFHDEKGEQSSYNKIILKDNKIGEIVLLENERMKKKISLQKEALTKKKLSDF